MAVMIDKFTKEAVPMTSFSACRAVCQRSDAGERCAVPRPIDGGMTLALVRNYDPFAAPTHFRLIDLLRKFGKKSGAGGACGGKSAQRHASTKLTVGIFCSSPACGSRSVQL